MILSKLARDIEEIAATATVVITIGPIGCGKSTLAGYLGELYRNVVPIDGDMLGVLTLKETLKLGDERNQYTIYQIVKVLIDGKIPVISTGGGAIMSGFGKKSAFKLREYIKKVTGIDIKIVTLIPKPIKDLEKFYGSHDVTSVVKA